MSLTASNHGDCALVWKVRNWPTVAGRTSELWAHNHQEIGLPRVTRRMRVPSIENSVWMEWSVNPYFTQGYMWTKGRGSSTPAFSSEASQAL
jgi:hypothetical protein